MVESRPSCNRAGLFGCLTPASAQVDGFSAIAFRDYGILTDADGARLADKNAAMASTNSVFSLGEQGMVSIAGSPEWQTPELAEEAVRGGDAAALALAWGQYGRALLEHLRGAYSFAIVDTEKDTFLAGIDRMGLHTLYYNTDSRLLCFGSTATAVLAQCSAEHLLSTQGIYDYFYFHMVPAPATAFSGIKKLPPAHCVEIVAGKENVFRYWTPPFTIRRQKDSASAKLQLKERLRSAVKDCISSSDNVGTFLSGGLDSSTVTGMLAEVSGSDHPAYAIGFDQEGYDEMEFARNTARHFGVPLEEYYVTPKDVLDALPLIATSYDEPFGNSSALPAYFVGKRAKEDGIDCLLAGDGGDEIFAGNERYAKQQVFGHYERVPRILREGLLKPAISKLPESLKLIAKARSYIQQAEVPLPDRLQTYNYLNRLGPAEIFSREFLDNVNTQEPLELQRETFHAVAAASELDRMLYLDWQYTLADNDLRKVSRMCAVAGVDVRYPMLDEDLVAFSCEIPDDWKLRRGDLRHFYKSALTGWLPEETINKKKQGFGLPFGHWMQSYKPLNEMANESLLRLRKRGYFRDDFLDRLLKLHREEHAAYYGEFIWILTVFDLWLEGRRDSTAQTVT